MSLPLHPPVKLQLVTYHTPKGRYSYAVEVAQTGQVLRHWQGIAAMSQAERTNLPVVRHHIRFAKGMFPWSSKRLVASRS